MKRSESERGMVTAELAMTIPVVLAIAYLLLSIAAAALTQLRVHDAAREAARAYAVEEDASTVRSIIAARAGQEAEVDVSYGERTVTVTITAPIDPIWQAAGIEATSSITALMEGR
ncbi:MAG: TadE family type IV pilus minor pilin [Flaviflexus sp.]|nr:TadE family type IV pilus minor pilin [Flaviflexus sp.]